MCCFFVFCFEFVVVVVVVFVASPKYKCNLLLKMFLLCQNFIDFCFYFLFFSSPKTKQQTNNETHQQILNREC